eukprot:SAG31_NODE_1646_length_7649_cov_3.317616_4_plen_75_part_00
MRQIRFVFIAALMFDLSFRRRALAAEHADAIEASAAAFAERTGKLEGRVAEHGHLIEVVVRIKIALIPSLFAPF